MSVVVVVVVADAAAVAVASVGVEMPVVVSEKPKLVAAVLVVELKAVAVGARDRSLAFVVAAPVAAVVAAVVAAAVVVVAVVGVTHSYAAAADDVEIHAVACSAALGVEPAAVAVVVADDMPPASGFVDYWGQTHSTHSCLDPFRQRCAITISNNVVLR